MLHSLQNRLTLILISFTVFTISSILLLYFYILRKEHNYSSFKHSVEVANTLILKDVTVLRDFFENETINSNFFATYKSKTLEHHDQLSQEIHLAIHYADTLQHINSYSLNADLNNLQSEFTAYDDLIKSIVKQILIRGFKDYGLEGKMRECAHRLETYDHEIGLINILQLRRHEKDFIIRQEDQYLNKHALLVENLVSSIRKKNDLGKKKKDEIIELLNSYKNYFISLSEYDRQIGIKNSIGLKKEIDDKVDSLESILQSIVSKSDELEEEGLTRLKVIFLSLLTLFIITSILMARFISKRATISLVELKEKISEFVASDFSMRTILPAKDPQNEVDELANNFGFMEQHIVNQMNALKKTNEDLATLIGQASHDIKKPLLEIRNYNDELLLQSNIDTSTPQYERYTKSWQKIIAVVDELSVVKDIKSEEIRIEKIDLVSLIQSAYHEHKNLPLYPSIVFSINFSLKEDFFSSKELLRIIFYHLFENAIQYSYKRNGHSFINVRIEGQGKHMIKITVTDNGIGIKKEDHEKIFNMFYRTSNQQEGTGLGLYIVQNSLEKINGAISLDSDESKGSKFTMLLPNKLYFEKSRKTMQEQSQAEFDSKGLVLNFI